MNKMMRNTLICLAASLLSVSAICAQDLSKYRNFSLGTSVASISKQVDARPEELRVTHQSPVLIQELTWWPIGSSNPAARSEAVQQIRFSFCNRQLYKIIVTYDETATKGLTAEDMVQAISARYGAATRPAADTNVSAPLSYSSDDTQIALWQDSRYSVALSRPQLSQSFQLVILSKELQTQADAAIAEAVAQEREEAPQRETARVKKEADDLQTLREANLKVFRP
jgi:hypothetical protein